MNLSKLFETQKQLDRRIEEEHGLENIDLFGKKTIAFRVELFELLNELPEEFKFWSLKENNYENALKEYVDTFHFLLSIGIELGVENRVHVSKMYGMTKRKSIEEMIDVIDQDVISLKNSHTYYEKSGKRYFDIGCYYNLVNKMVALGEMLGFTWEQIEQAYFAKNEINHDRQANGY